MRRHEAVYPSKCLVLCVDTNSSDPNGHDLGFLSLLSESASNSYEDGTSSNGSGGQGDASSTATGPTPAPPPPPPSSAVALPACGRHKHVMRIECTILNCLSHALCRSAGPVGWRCTACNAE